MYQYYPPSPPDKIWYEPQLINLLDINLSNLLNDDICVVRIKGDIGLGCPENEIFPE